MYHDYIITPERVVSSVERGDRPAGILWDLLDSKKEEIKILRNLRTG